MDGKQLIKLAADFSAGSVTAAAIRETYGEGTLSAVTALVAGGLVGLATDAALDAVDEHTGIVSAAGEVVDTVVLNPIKSLFDW